jgi:hypothetical protein
LTGIKPGTEVRVYDAETGVELATGVESSVDDEFVYAYNYEGKSIYFVLVNLDYNIIRLEMQQTSTPSVIPIQQTTDRVYNNPA